MTTNNASPGPAAQREWADAATEDDIYFAYRLLLGREPDAPGWKVHRDLINDKKLTPAELARQFMRSTEFQSYGHDPLADGTLIEIPMEGFSLFVRANDRDIGHHVRTFRSYEPHVTAALRNTLRPDMVFIDVGANLGVFTNMAASLVGPRGLVIAIEPLDKNLQLLYRAVAHNRFENVRVHACAAGERVELISIKTDPGTSNGQPLPKTSDDPRAFFTQTRRLDDLTAGVARMDVVKFDIDGYELFAWRGFRQQLARFRPIVLTEFHPYGMEQYVKIDPLEYLGELFAYGAVDVLEQSDGLPRTTCSTPAHVMQQWEAANEAGSTTMHLDLIITPRA